ncbi:restriction endonuclease subunit S [Bradyrhizobium lablabi]|uniref:restriction endonuclease subunit S n=1 Tax=Bradyrhizobium lablabi TaxID=722472 RepID=UPI00090AC049|nr:restriction endonuclease subunit S [Bradyrhizobium lablabi]SHL55052.1 type I restriction enzyme, S subunit [Bradyrhizobium lablabi]
MKEIFSWLGPLPIGWQQTKLKRVVDASRPITYGIVQAGPMIEGGVPYIRPTDMSDEVGVTDFSSLLRTSEEIAASYKRSSLRQGDIVCTIGPSYGKVMVTPAELEGANLTQGTARVAVDGRHSTRYYFWVLRSCFSFSQWESSIGGATFRALNLEPLAETIIPEPPISEQTAIASLLDRETTKIDALVREQQRLIELLKEKRRAVISHAVTKGLNSNVEMRDAGVEWLGEVPKHWDLIRLKFVSPEITVGIVVEPSKYYCEDGVPALRSLNVQPGAIRLENLVYISEEANDLLCKSKLYSGDLVAVRTGQPGTVAVVPDNLNGCNCIDLIIIRRPNGDCEQFLCWYLASDFAVRQFTEGSEGAIQQHFNVSTAKSLFVVRPPKSEQEEIASFLSKETKKIDALVAEAEDGIRLLQERRAALIAAAVTGKIDVRGPIEVKGPTPEVVAA